MQKPTFKKGDVLVCIDSSDKSGFLTVGKEYESLTDSYSDFCGRHFIRIETDSSGLTVSIRAERFKLKEQPNPKRHKHADLIIAWAEGAEIEYYHKYYNEWFNDDVPTWDEDYQYRIKPAVPDDIVLTGRVYLGEEDGKPNVQYTFDGVTSELKDVKLLASEDC